MRSGPPVCCHTSAVSFSPAAPCYAHKGRIYATRCRTQGLDSAVVCRAVFPYSRPCVRHRGGKGAKEGRGAEPRGKERLGFQGTAPAPRPHTFGYTQGLPGGQPATRLSLGGRRSAAVPLPLPAPLGPGEEGTPTGGGAPASASTPTWGAKGAAVPPGGPKCVWVSGLSGGFPDGCSKMRLSLGEITGIGPKPSNSDAKWNTAPPHCRNTAKPRSILDHYDTRTAPHHITATAKAATGPPHASRSSSAYSSMRESGSARRTRAGPPPRTHRCASRDPPAARERVLRLPQTYSARSAAPRGRTGSMREGRARHLREPAAPARVVPGGALDPDAVARHCCPRDRVVPGPDGQRPRVGRRRSHVRQEAHGAQDERPGGQFHGGHRGLVGECRGGLDAPGAHCLERVGDDPLGGRDR